jgi:hypothetical protein
MNDRSDQKLEAMLRSRRLEPAGADLAERVILKAETVPQIPTLPLSEWMGRLFAEFHLPRPAYVLACTLILGLIVGFNTSPDPPADDGDAVHVQSFLYPEEAVL